MAASGAAHAVLDCEINGQSVNPSNGATTAGKTGLMRCKDRDTGLLQREEELRNGQSIGLVRFYERGKLVKEHSRNANGNLQGRGREFGPEGQVMFEGEYDNGRLVGIARRFHPGGQLRGVSFHANDERDRAPQASVSLNAQGQVTDLRCGPQPQLAPLFDDAKACGFGSTSTLDLYTERGVLQAKGTWQSGQRIKFSRVDEQGRPRSEELVEGDKRIDREFANGIKRRERERVVVGNEIRSARQAEYSEDGTLVREQRSAEGRAVSDYQFYLNGQPKRKADWSWSGAMATVTETEHRDDGGVSAKGQWSEDRGGRRVALGTHQRFNASNRLVGEKVYDDRGKLARERAWDDNGTLLRDDAVFEDGSRKAWAR